MLTTAERAKLASDAQKIKPVFQIGKNTLTDAVVTAVSDALDARELIKLSVLAGADAEPKAVLAELCEKLGAEPIASIGQKIVLFRKSERLAREKAIKEKNAKKIAIKAKILESERARGNSEKTVRRVPKKAN